MANTIPFGHTDWAGVVGDMAIVPVEQYFEFAHGLPDQFYVMRRGAVSASGPAGGFDKQDLRGKVSV